MSRQIEISDEVFEKLSSELKGQMVSEESIDISSNKDFEGKNWFIRTVTYHWVGKVKKVSGKFFILENASWIADSGRFMQAIKDGELNEVEPVGIAIVNIETIVDICPWTHKLPTKQK
jgi:hypothetical protein